MPLRKRFIAGVVILSAAALAGFGLTGFGLTGIGLATPNSARHLAQVAGAGGVSLSRRAKGPR